MSALVFSSFLSLLFLLLTSSLPLTFSSSQSQCDEADKIALLKIKNSFGDPPELVSWDSSTDCCSSWYGIGCHDNGKVQYFSVSWANFSGSIPSSIGDLSALTTLHISNLPNLTGPIPGSVAKLTKLNELTILTTSVSGNIPAFLCRLPELTYLNLFNNRLIGSIPACLGRRRLETLDLSQNQLSGLIPPSLMGYNSDHSYDRNLVLSRNQLSGVIPQSFGNIRFHDLDLSHNRLTGDASHIFGVPKYSFHWIDLSWNELDFDLSSVEFPLFLTDINLSHNKIRGKVPKQITKLVDLRFLDLSYNMLCGKIPNLTYMSGSLALDHNKCLCGAPLTPCRSLL